MSPVVMTIALAGRASPWPGPMVAIDSERCIRTPCMSKPCTPKQLGERENRSCLRARIASRSRHLSEGRLCRQASTVRTSTPAFSMSYMFASCVTGEFQ
eukprot:scaffold3464_cov406-Prasinococcus_capsulatus_cf.AAC.4